MILNKIQSPARPINLKALRFKLFVLSLLTLISCNKSGINANSSYVALTNVAYDLGPVGMYLNGEKKFTTPVSFGNTSGTPGNPYDTTASKVSLMSFYIAPDTSNIIQGNAAFRQNARYSIFLFDTLGVNSVSLGLIVLQDNPTILQDTFTYYRFLNFSPGDTLWGLKLINNRKDNPNSKDTLFVTQSPFVGLNNNPAAYPMTSTIRSGNYSVYAFKNSVNPQSDTTLVYTSLGIQQIDSLINYNIYLQGFYGDTTSVNKFQLKVVPLNSH